MKGNSRTNEKGKAPASANPLIEAHNDYAKIISPNIHTAQGVNFQQGNFNGNHFDYFKDMPLSMASWEDIHQSVTSGNHINFQNPQINLNSNTANTNLQEVSLLPDWNMKWSQHPTISGSFGVESYYESVNKPKVNSDIADSSFMFRPKDTLPVHTRNNVDFNTSQHGVQGKVESNFLSLGIGATEESISDKLKEAASAGLKRARAQRAVGQTSGQTFSTDFMGSHRNSNRFFNQLNQDRMTSTNNEIGNHCTVNSGPGSSPYHTLPIQQNDSSRNSKFSDLDYYKAIVGNQTVNPGTIGGNSGQFLNSEQHNLNNLAQDFVNHSRVTSHTPSGQLHNVHFRTVNNLPSDFSMNSPTSIGLGNSSARQNYPGQIISQNATSTQNLGGSLFSQRTTTPQISWVNSGPTSIDAPFPKRLGVEFNGKNNPQITQKHPSVVRTNLQAVSTDRVHGAPVSYPLNNQEPFYAHGPHGQSQDAMIQLPKNPQGAPPPNASTVRPYRKRSAVVPHPPSNWIQRQRNHPIPNTPTTIHHPIPPNTHPTIHHPIPNTPPTIPHSIPPVLSHTQPVGHVTKPPSHVRPRVHVTTTTAPVPTVTHITRKDPVTSPPKLTGHKCLLCKRDLALTSEGAVYQPAVPPPVAVLPCGHTFHDQCLQNITPQDQAKDPPCIPCAIGEN